MLMIDVKSYTKIFMASLCKGTVKYCILIKRGKSIHFSVFGITVRACDFSKLWRTHCYSYKEIFSQTEFLEVSWYIRTKCSLVSILFHLYFP